MPYPHLVSSLWLFRSSCIITCYLLLLPLICLAVLSILRGVAFQRQADTHNSSAATFGADKSGGLPSTTLLFGFTPYFIHQQKSDQQRTYPASNPRDLCAMSDSEDDFMSDKFLVDVPVETTYASRRSKAALEGLRKSQAHNARNVPLREREEMRRKEGLSTSLFHQGESSSSRGGIGSSARPSAPPPKETGQSKAMDLMKKMGWNVGESLGRRRSASPERKEKKAEPIRISMWAGTWRVRRD